MSVIRRFICFIFMVLSLIAIVGISMIFATIALNFNYVFDFEAFMNSLGTSSIEDILQTLGYFLFVVFQVYGIPLIIFLISLIGLTVGKK